MKAQNASQVKSFTDIPNIGRAMVNDFIILGIKTPAEDHDPVSMILDSITL
jgi:hypothetical protein